MHREFAGTRSVAATSRPCRRAVPRILNIQGAAVPPRIRALCPGQIPWGGNSGVDLLRYRSKTGFPSSGRVRDLGGVLSKRPQEVGSIRLAPLARDLDLVAGPVELQP